MLMLPEEILEDTFNIENLIPQKLVHLSISDILEAGKEISFSFSTVTVVSF
jgi:hypothetical protein